MVLAAGNQDALLELYDRYAGLAYAVAMRVLGDPARAEDAVQEAFLKIWTNASSFDPRKGSLRTWLITAVRNRSIDFLRGRGAHEREELELQPDLAESHRSEGRAARVLRWVLAGRDRGHDQGPGQHGQGQDATCPGEAEFVSPG